MHPRNNKRITYRINLPIPLCARTSIVAVSDKSVKSGSTRICVHNISAGGLLFASNLSLPINPNVIYQFNLTLYKKNISLLGCIVRTAEVTPYSYKYGVKFVHMDEATHQSLSKILNIIDIRIRQGINLNSCEFCNRDNSDCWNRSYGGVY